MLINKTELCRLLNIKYPLIQGGMAWISDAKLAASVSEAGGLGVIAAGQATGDVIRSEIQIAKTLTQKPFGVNIMLMSPYVEEVAYVAAEEKVSVIITGAGNPAKYMSIWKDSVVIPVVASTALAKIMARSGASAIIAEGTESGGHVGELTTMTLVPQVCDSVNIPVIAAGGIGDGRGIAAVFMLGAVGVQVGTRFLLAEECPVHPHYKNLVLKARDISTITTGKRIGHPVRSLKTCFSQHFASLEYDSSITNEELSVLGNGALKRAAVDGDIINGCFMAGQIAGMLTRQQTVKEIIDEIFIEAERIIDNWAK